MNAMLRRTTRSLLALAALGAGATLDGCGGLLDVTNPSAITESNLKADDQTIAFMANGVQGEFRREFAWLAAHGAVFTDEAIQGHPWPPWNAYDARNITPDSPAYDGLTYQLLQRARGTADELIPKMESALGSRAASSAALARAYAYAGYSYLMVADYMCSAPINKSKPLSQDSLYRMAEARFDKAITIGGAAGADGAEIVKIARVGRARAALDLNDKTGAIAAATPVATSDPTWTAWVRYASDPSDWQVYNFMNWFAGYRYAGELDLALDPGAFATLNDTRVPINRDSTFALGDGRRRALLPYEPTSYSDYAPGKKALFSETAAIRFASGLEARYILAEAGAYAPAQLRAFVDERRAAGGQPVFAGGDAQLFDELLVQRARDFFLDGHRMGDLRRYKHYDARDFWPTGQMPGLPAGTSYGTQECWPIAQSERNSNPNVP